MKPDFMDVTAKIMAEIRARTCIDKSDTKFIEEILQDALEEGYSLGYSEGTLRVILSL